MKSESPRSRDAEPGETPARAPAPRNPLRRLRLALILVFALAGGAAAWILATGSRPVPEPLTTPDAGEGVAQRALNLDTTRTRKGLPSIRVTAREGITYEGGRIELKDVKVTLFGPQQEPTEVLAPRAVSGEGGKGGWTFEDGVEMRASDGARVRMPQLQYREGPQEIIADGEVSFESGEIRGKASGLRYFLGRRRLEFTTRFEVVQGIEGIGVSSLVADSASLEKDASKMLLRAYRAGGPQGGTFEGAFLEITFSDTEPRRVRRLEARDGFLVRHPGAASGAGAGLLGAGASELSGREMTTDLSEAGRPERLEARGEVRFASGARAEEARRLAASRLDVHFEGGEPSRIVAEGDAVLTLPPRERQRASALASLAAARLEAEITAATGAWRSVTAIGNVSAEEGGRRLVAARALYDVAGQRWILDGEGDAPARAEGEGVAISALHLEVARSDGSLDARGGTKTMVSPRPRTASPARAAGGPGRSASSLFGSQEGPIHAMSESLQASRDSRQAKYRGRVRIWQGGGSLDADAVDVDDAAGVLEARGNVVARVPARPAAPGGVAGLVTVSAAELRYARESGEARFKGGVRVLSGTARIDASEVVARSQEGQGIRNVEAAGPVRLMEGTRRGEGDALTADLAAGRYVLSGRGRLASIQDQANQQVVRGHVLTYEEASDRILVESESGGRTWITLKPPPGEGKKGDPEPPR